MERSRSPRVIIIFILATVAAWYYVSWLGPKYHTEADASASDSLEAAIPS